MRWIVYIGVVEILMAALGYPPDAARVLSNQADETYPPDYKVPINFFSDPAYFNKSSTHVDFSWAIPSAP